MQGLFSRVPDEIDIGSMIRSFPGSGGKKLFLRRFTVEDLENIMIKAGIFEYLKIKGFKELCTAIDIDDSYVNYWRLYYKNEEPQNVIMDIRLTETKFFPDKKFFSDGEAPKIYDMIVIEWLSLQNPLSEQYTRDRPQLPGQTRPGLGLLKYCFDMMYRVAKDVYKDGFLDVPDHLHGAIMYSKKFKYFDPFQEACLRSIIRDLKGYSLADISWGMITETIYEKAGNKAFVFQPSEQIFSVSKRMKTYFRSKKYIWAFNEYYNKFRFYLKYDEMIEKRDLLLKEKKVSDL